MAEIPWGPKPQPLNPEEYEPELIEQFSYLDRRIAQVEAILLNEKVRPSRLASVVLLIGVLCTCPSLLFPPWKYDVEEVNFVRKPLGGDRSTLERVYDTPDTRAWGYRFIFSPPTSFRATWSGNRGFGSMSAEGAVNFRIDLVRWFATTAVLILVTLAAYAFARSRAQFVRRK